MEQRFSNKLLSFPWHTKPHSLQQLSPHTAHHTAVRGPRSAAGSVPPSRGETRNHAPGPLRSCDGGSGGSEPVLPSVASQASNSDVQLSRMPQAWPYKVDVSPDRWSLLSLSCAAEFDVVCQDSSAAPSPMRFAFVHATHGPLHASRLRRNTHCALSMGSAHGRMFQRNLASGQRNTNHLGVPDLILQN